MNLYCAVCMYTGGGETAHEAVTVMGGTAVCDEHLGYAQPGDDAVRFAIQQKKEGRS